MRSMSLVVDLIDLVTKHKSGELRCPATALINNIMSIGYFGTKRLAANGTRLNFTAANLRAHRLRDLAHAQ